MKNGSIDGSIDGSIEFPTLLHRNIYNAISFNPKIKVISLADNIGVSQRSIARIIADLKALNLISRVGGSKHGEWIVKKI